MNKIVQIIAGFALIGAGLVHAEDGQKFYKEDSAPAIRFLNSGSENVVITITTNGAGGNMTVAIGSVTTTIDGSGAIDTVAELAAAITACTNSAGLKVLRADTSCVVATTESTDGELLDGATTIVPGAWGSIYWDTSIALHYRVNIPKASDGAGRGGVYVDSVYGNPGGTGNLTVSGYIDGTKVFEQVLVSPVYVPTITNVNNAADAVIVLDLPVGVYVGQDQAFVLSADRATSATTGGVGVRTKSK